MSTMLFDVLFAWKCSSTHHKLAMDALRFLRGIDAEAWRNLFLEHIESYLEGAKAPDNKFKDFRNHVLHVKHGYWGGAIGAAELWYGRTVDALSRRQWSEAAYAAGVLSHYYSDPIQPFHTDQSEAEGAVHRAAEWSIAKCYEEFQNILELDRGGYPEVEVPPGGDWLGEMIRHGANLAHPHYDVLIDHYNLKAGVRNPPAGLDQESKDRLAGLVGHAVVGFSRILDRAISESHTTPPETFVTLEGVLASLTIPIFWVTKHIRDRTERAEIEAIYDEFRRNGKVIHALPEDDRTIRKLFAAEVLHKPLGQLDAEPARRPGTLFGSGAPRRRVFNEPRTEASPPLSLPLEHPSVGRPMIFAHAEHLPEEHPRPRIELPPPEPVDPLRPFRPVGKMLRRAPRVRSAPPSPVVEPVANDAPTDAPSEPLLAAAAAVESTTVAAQAKRGLRSITNKLLRRPQTAAEPAAATETSPPAAEALAAAATSTTGPAARRRPWWSRRKNEAPETTADETERREPEGEASEKPDLEPLAPLAENDRRASEKPRRAAIQRAESPAADTEPTQGKSSQQDRFYLELNSPLVDAPSIGQKTADRFAQIGIRTVEQFLELNASEVAKRLNLKNFNAALLRDWQDQARLMLSVPGLRGHDAQILVGSEVRDAATLAAHSPTALLTAARAFLKTSAGQRVLRGGTPPDAEEVDGWVDAATRARAL